MAPIRKGRQLLPLLFAALLAAQLACASFVEVSSSVRVVPPAAAEDAPAPAADAVQHRDWIMSGDVQQPKPQVLPQLLPSDPQPPSQEINTPASPALDALAPVDAAQPAAISMLVDPIPEQLRVASFSAVPPTGVPLDPVEAEAPAVSSVEVVETASSVPSVADRAAAMAAFRSRLARSIRGVLASLFEAPQGDLMDSPAMLFPESLPEGAQTRTTVFPGGFAVVSEFHAGAADAEGAAAVAPVDADSVEAPSSADSVETESEHGPWSPRGPHPPNPFAALFSRLLGSHPPPPPPFGAPSGWGFPGTVRHAADHSVSDVDADDDEVEFPVLRQQEHIRLDADEPPPHIQLFGMRRGGAFARFRSFLDHQRFPGGRPHGPDGGPMGGAGPRGRFFHDGPRHRRHHDEPSEGEHEEEEDQERVFVEAEEVSAPPMEVAYEPHTAPSEEEQQAAGAGFVAPHWNPPPRPTPRDDDFNEGFAETSSSSGPASSPGHGHRRRHRGHHGQSVKRWVKHHKVLVICASIGLLLLVIISVICCVRRRKQRRAAALQTGVLQQSLPQTAPPLPFAPPQPHNPYYRPPGAHVLANPYAPLPPVPMQSSVEFSYPQLQYAHAQPVQAYRTQLQEPLLGR